MWPHPPTTSPLPNPGHRIAADRNKTPSEDSRKDKVFGLWGPVMGVHMVWASARGGDTHLPLPPSPGHHSASLLLARLRPRRPHPLLCPQAPLPSMVQPQGEGGWVAGRQRGGGESGAGAEACLHPQSLVVGWWAPWGAHVSHVCEESKNERTNKNKTKRTHGPW